MDPLNKEQGNHANFILISRKFLSVIIVALVLLVQHGDSRPNHNDDKCRLLDVSPSLGDTMTLTSPNNLAMLKTGAYIVIYQIKTDWPTLGFLKLDNASLNYEPDEIAPKITLSFDCGEIIMVQSKDKAQDSIYVEKVSGHLTYFNDKINEDKKLFKWDTHHLFRQQEDLGHYHCDRRRSYCSYKDLRGQKSFPLFYFLNFELETDRDPKTSRDQFYSPRSPVWCH